MTNQPAQPPPCPGCGGSGQTGFFNGESRFLMSWVDCPDCAGTGVLLQEDPRAENPNRDSQSPTEQK